MTTMYVLSNIEGVASGQRWRAYATEDGAYAALGRLATLHGGVGDMAVIEVEVIGEAAPAAAPATTPRSSPARPEWLDRDLPGPWGAEDGEIVGRNGEVVVLDSADHADQSRALAVYIAALVNADAPGGT